MSRDIRLSDFLILRHAYSVHSIAFLFARCFPMVCHVRVLIFLNLLFTNYFGLCLLNMGDYIKQVFANKSGTIDRINKGRGNFSVTI